MRSGSALLCALPVLSLASACGNGAASSASSTPAISIGNSADNVYTLEFTSYSALQNTGGCVHVSIAATSGTKDLYVTRVSSTSVIAVTTVCTHQGCTINSYNATAQDYSCPCHGSVFNSSGAVVNGPATQALQSYTGAITGTGVQLTVS